MWKVVVMSAAMLSSASSSFAQVPQHNRGYLDLGGGVAVSPDATSSEPHVSVDIGYRLSRVNADIPINAQSIVAGIGYKF